MTIPNIAANPTIWDDEALAKHAQDALEAFVERRLAEPSQQYVKHLKARKRDLFRLIRLLSSVDPQNPDIEVVRKILLDNDLKSSLRYVTGPPISDDDLGVIVTRSPKRLSKTAIKRDSGLANEVLNMICRLSDSERFPWIQENRRPRLYELKQAIRTTTALHATQTMQTERRGYGKKIEHILRTRVEGIGFRKVPTPNGGRVTKPKHVPSNKTFYGECSVHGRRADLLIGLSDGRCVAVEAKNSSSVVNSVKRVLNDTAAKAGHWREIFGETIVPVAFLSGVFGVDDLKSAQSSGLYLIWLHDLDSFIDWLSTQK